MKKVNKIILFKVDEQEENQINSLKMTQLKYFTNKMKLSWKKMIEIEDINLDVKTVWISLKNLQNYLRWHGKSTMPNIADK